LLIKIDEIANKLFSEFDPATLKKNEVQFFDSEIEFIVDVVLSSKSTHKINRKRMLDEADVIEESNNNVKEEVDMDDDNENNEFNSSIKMELRRAIKTVEVMGCIIKNRKGSLEIDQIKKIFEDAMNVQLRILTSFFNLINHKDGQDYILEAFSKKIEKIIKENDIDGNISKHKILKVSKKLFWNYNFIFINVIIFKIIRSLGSDKLIRSSDGKITMISDEVCDKINTPASFLVKHGILMWYKKNWHSQIGY
jgi:hypothetical protein